MNTVCPSQKKALKSFSFISFAALLTIIFLYSCTNTVQPVTTANQVTRTDIYVGSRNTSSVKKYDGKTGAYIGDFISTGSGGLNTTQDLLFLSDSVLLVKGINNTAIKKYNGINGAYIGDFTSGYMLANPTKMSLGKDGLIYVSQWGTTQNKIVRFNRAGVFVNEFTSTGVPFGLGHAWDSTGNFYAASFGNGNNGRIYKFSSTGTLISTFIPPGNLQGPSNLWFNSTGDLFVTDWTMGKVQHFNTQGQFIGTYVSGMANIEGFAFLPDKSLLLSDWTLNHINKYDSLGVSQGSFINSGGLSSPNSISVRVTNIN